MSANIQKPTPVPLKIAVVGGGLVGITVAAALRREGQLVDIFEASNGKEFGAGLVIPPNSQKILFPLGFKHENARGVPTLGWEIRRSNTEGVAIHAPMEPISYTVHRVDYSQELLRLAVSEDLPGVPAKLHLNTEVTSVDCASATVHLKYGESRSFDLVIGTDGLYSMVRTHVVGHKVDAIRRSPPAAVHRWLTPASELQASPDKKWLYSDDKHYVNGITDSGDNMLVTYALRDNTVINFAALHVDKRDPATIKGRSQATTRERVFEDFAEFHDSYKALFPSENQEVRTWELIKLPPLPTWNNGRTCIIGDAAHSMLPYAAQGCALGMEDAGMLAILLPLGTTIDDIPARLAAHQELRKERVERISNLTDFGLHFDAGKEVVCTATDEDFHFMYGYDGPEIARQYLKKHFPMAVEPESSPHVTA